MYIRSLFVYAAVQGGFSEYTQRDVLIVPSQFPLPDIAQSGQHCSFSKSCPRALQDCPPLVPMSLGIVVSQLLAPFDTKVRSYLGGLSKQRNRNDGAAKLISSQ